MNGRRSLLGEKVPPAGALRKYRPEPEPSDPAKELVERIGKEFVETAKTNRNQAWKDLNETIMLNLAVLTGSRLLEPLRNIITTMTEVDRNIFASDKGGPSSGQTLDVIAAAWTLGDEEEAATKNA